ncbi:MAG: hypothetical protein RRY23_05530 [Alistipes sp.]
MNESTNWSERTYSAPTLDQLNLCVEQGFAQSTQSDWSYDPTITDADSNDLGTY